MKYRKKPVVVEAYQTDKEMIIHTLEGDMKASVGDFVITGVNGEQYPCKPDIFEKTYERICDEQPTIDTIPVVRCKDCAYWCICHHGDNWFCADGTPINTASDYYDDKGHLRHNPPTCKSIYGERKDNGVDSRRRKEK